MLRFTALKKLDCDPEAMGEGNERGPDERCASVGGHDKSTIPPKLGKPCQPIISNVLVRDLTNRVLDFGEKLWIAIFAFEAGRASDRFGTDDRNVSVWIGDESVFAVFGYAVLKDIRHDDLRGLAKDILIRRTNQKTGAPCSS
ncbi:MAG: hypothetical protein V4618_20085 [Pseudomonadota bacterium]